ncbi:MAG: OmpA family protein [Bacteroidota bacterium]
MRYRQVILLLVFSFLCHSIPAQKDDCEKIKNKDAVKKFERAVSLLGPELKGYRNDEAYKLLKDAIEEEPVYYHAYYLLARINYKRALDAMRDPREIQNVGRYNQQFVKYLDKVVEICPAYDDFSSYYLLGEYYYSEKDYNNAQKFLNLYISNCKDGVGKMEVARNYVQKCHSFNELRNNPVEFNPERLEGICTVEDEFLPLISPDGEIAFYTKRYFKKTGIGADKTLVNEFRYSKRRSAINDKKEIYEGGEPMPLPFNKEGINQGGISVTIDNRFLYITICQPTNIRMEGGGYYENCDIYYSVFEDGKWGPLLDAGPNVNGQKTWEAQPSITSDGKMLFFASARPDTKGIGGIDIYYSEKDEKGQWGPAKNLGPVINTTKNEKSPFIHSDSQTLYFASDGHNGLGGFDIFFSKFESGKWTVPKNIGYPINTESDDLGFVVSASGHKAYLSSNRFNENGDLDIFSFNLHENARPKEVQIVKGDLKDDKGEVVQDAELKIKNTVTGDETEAMVDKINGKYAVALRLETPDDEFIMTVKKEDYAFTSAYIKPRESEELTPIKVDLEVKPVELGQQVEIRDIHFATSSAIFDKASMTVLNNFIEWLEDNPDIRIEIHGHTDNIGDPDSNMKLSEERAQSVFNYLLLFGIESDRVTAYHGFGETKPVANNKTTEGRAKNRRVEFVIVGK